VKVYASSFRLCSQPQRFSDLLSGSARLAVIPNALDFSTDNAWRKKWLEREFRDLEALGLQSEAVDLRDFFDSPHSLGEELGAFDGVWVLGGNVFMLRRAMQYSGFDKFVWGKRERKAKFVYGGYSAGSCVLAPSLRGLDLVDPPDQIAPGYRPEVLWEGLGILGYSIAPHFESDHSEAERIGTVVDYFKEQKISYRALRDGESIVVDLENSS
jgi:dipeptidase E